MPGETVLEISQYPDDFQLFTRCDNPLVAPVANHPIFIADRDLIIDVVTIRYATAGGAAETAKLKWVPTGTAIAGTGTDITSTGLIDRTADTNYALTVTTTANLVPAGAMVFLVLSSAATVKGVSVTVRVRSRRQ